MPHALSERQKEYLRFLQRYIRKNEMTPSLEEVAGHFGVKLPTAHKILDALQKKGFLSFRRESISGYYIRLTNRGGGFEKLIEIMVVGNIDTYGEIVNFPEEHGHFPAVLIGVDETQVFALEATQDIPQANILAGDHLICDLGKRPQSGDIAIMPWGKHSGRWFLCKVHSLTHDAELYTLEASNQYPIPEGLLDTSYGQRLNWLPISYSDETEAYLLEEAKNEHVPLIPVPPEFAAATVLRLSRTLAF